MRTDYEFSNVLGGTYSDGNLVFTKDGGSLLSPVSNRVALYDLAQNRNVALPFETNRNIVLMDLTQEEDLLALADNEAQITFVHFPSSTKLETFWAKGSKSLVAPTLLKFSPDGRSLVVSVADSLEVWSTPTPRVLQFRSISNLSRLSVTKAVPRCLRWFQDSEHLVVGYDDNTVRIMPKMIPYARNIEKMRRFNPVYVLPPMKNPIAFVCFLNEAQTQLCYITVDAYAAQADMQLDQRTPSELNRDKNSHRLPKLPYNLRKWTVDKRIPLPGGQGLKGIQSADYNAALRLLAIGYRTGKFILYNLPEGPELSFTPLQEMAMSSQSITTTTLNGRGDWLAMGSTKLGQVVVWDWKSETYVLRQQAHQAADTTCLAYSADGSIVATGGEDGKVKGWKGAHSYCFVTFTEHTGAIVDVKFNSTNSLFSASMDGTIRAYDMNRYRHYRVFTTPKPVQFSCIALDTSGEVIAAGCADIFDVYVWSAKSGRILEVLSGHEGPVSRVHFSPVENVLVSGSWDKTIKVWPLFIGEERTKENAESLPLLADVLFVCFNNSGKELAALTLAGVIEFFDTQDLKQIKQSKGGLDISRDITGGYMMEELTKPGTQTAGRYVDTAAYSANDMALLVAGYTKWICMYDTAHRLLLRRWQLSSNLSLDGIREFYDYRATTEAGNKKLIDAQEVTDTDGLIIELPGVERGKPGSVGKRSTRPVARTKQVAFAPNGREWAAATTAGLLIYSLDGSAASFRPLKLEYGLTPQEVYKTLAEGNYGKALHQALQLNDEAVLRAVLYGVPPSHVEFVATQVPAGHLGQMLELVAAELARTTHFQFCLEWALQLQLKHAVLMQRENLQPQLKELARVMAMKATELKAMADRNMYGMRYLQCVAALQQKQAAEEEWPESEEETSTPVTTDKNDAAKAKPHKRRAKQLKPEATEAKKDGPKASHKLKGLQPKKKRKVTASG
eukprot:EG_transcript_1595